MKKERIRDALNIAVKVAAKYFFAGQPGQARLQVGIRHILAKAFHEWGAAEQHQFLELCEKSKESPDRPPPELVARLRRALADEGMRQWAGQNAAVAAGPGESLAEEWRAGVKPANLDALLRAAAGFAVDRLDQAGRDLLKASFDRFLKERIKPMATLFKFDPRGLPANFLDVPAGGGAGPSQTFEARVEAILKEAVGITGVSDSDKDTIAAIKGILLLNEMFYPGAFGFRTAVTDAWSFSLQTTRRLQPKNGSQDATNREMYDEVVNQIAAFRNTGDGGDINIFLQEVASVSKYVIGNALSIPIDHPNFSTQVRIGLQKYVEGAPPSESLDLPPLTGDGAQDVEIEPPNIEAVSVVYASLQVERMRMFHVIDRITELFMNGLLPIGAGAASKALDDYYWNSDERLTEGARNAVYARVLGAPGADVSKEVTPNRDFDNLFMRFVSSLAEYDRQRRVADIFDNRGRSLVLSGEQVRKSGRDLAGNVSLYGWGGTQPVARRLKQHILTSLDLLDRAEIQKVYGVSTAYQVIERVALNEFGQAPNIVKYKTLADAGKTLLRLLAKYAQAWSINTGRPLFTDTSPVFGAAGLPGDIPPEDEAVLMLQAQNILAVQGIADDQVNKYSSPSDTTYAPSMPAFGAVSPTTIGSNGSGDLVGKLQQMVAAGNAPSVDQLKQLLPAMKM